MKKLVTVLGLLAIIIITAFAIDRTPTPPASVTLAWDKSTGTNIIATYRVYYGVASATYTNTVVAGTNLTATVTNLARGVTYWFAATAMDTSGLESDYSNEVSTRTKTQPGAPSVLNITGSN